MGHSTRKRAAILIALAGGGACGGTLSPQSAPPGVASSSSSSSWIPDNETNCVDVELSPADLTCTTDEDCTLVGTGVLCAGYIPNEICETSAANSSGAARILAQRASIPADPNPPADAFCDTVVGTPRCLQGQCTDCDPFGAGPAACLAAQEVDAAIDAGPPVDASPDAAIDAGPPVDASPDAAIDAAETGGPCATSSDCPAGFGCGFLIAEGCSAHGQCLAPPSGTNCASGAIECGCDGARVTVPQCDGYNGIYGLAPVAPAWTFASDGGCIIEPGDAGADADGAPSED